MNPNDGSRALGRQECLRPMDRAPISHVVCTRGALPAVLPVNFVLDADGWVLLRASAASELVRSIDGAVVAFEVDDVDAAGHCGWSIVVTGAATVVTDAAEHECLDRTGPVSWVPAPQEVFVRIEPELVAGREFVGGRTVYGVDVTA
ncbi:pyridoxamine 5'-phosphate oxidase family protein [Streptomyces sp. NPDC087859]|uniref:pyridoxamine 5'-phosphate oxidase family protein n=1 Tax=Streptomyces sp. NPDC087859 TaxID=3365812 RepID=UPI003805362E